MNCTYEGYFRLPLLEYLAHAMPKDLLGDVYLIGCQHILPSTHLMLKSMMDLGLQAENIGMIGKCYSTSKLAMENMIQDGIYVCKSSVSFDSHESFDAQFRNNIEMFLKQQIIKMDIKKDSKIIILDDGGELLLAAHNLLTDYKYIYGVEQTSSGYHKLNEVDLRYPIVNVARSKAKLNIESPMIIESIDTQLTNALSVLSLKPTSCLIIGNGYIGKCLLERLQNRYALINCYDIERYKSDLTHMDLNEYDLIIGATGRNVISNNNMLRKGHILVSVSSSDREFNSVTFRNLLPRNTDCHQHVLCNDVWLLNSGFPINFYGTDYDNVPLLDIQLTIGLLFSGVLQLLSRMEHHYGFIELDENLQNTIISNYTIS
jgi:S-adenosylhomocysteine hydrolase